MCPLRYIILFISALVALVVLVWGIKDEEDEKLNSLLSADDRSTAEEKSKERAGAEEEIPGDTPRPARMIDFLNGRYLYDKYQLYQAMSRRRSAPKR